MPTEEEKKAAYEAQQANVRLALQTWGPAIEGRVAVITGAARGIGKTTAEALLACGAMVVATDRSWSGADELRGRLEDSGHGLALTMDVSEDGDLGTAYDAVIEKFGTTDILINCAGLVSETLFAPLGHVKTLDTTDRDWEAMFEVNLFGALKTIRRFIQPMRAQRRGSIVNVLSSGILTVSQGGSYQGLRPNGLEMPYQATKAALMALGFYLGDEIREEGIAVNAYMPGHTRASWFDATARAYGERDQVYGIRPVVPEHVLPLTLLLAGQDASGVTGRLFHIPDWNYDHGFGDYRFWFDRWLPADMEEGYRKLEESGLLPPNMRLP